MKATIVYDTAYGNTGRVALAIAQALRNDYRVELLGVEKASGLTLDDIDLLVVGSPTQGGRPTIAIQKFLGSLPRLHHISVAVFDTRFGNKGHSITLKLLMRAVGHAAEKMAAALRVKGASLVSPPMGFIVEDKEGPLARGELQRAAAWAHEIAHESIEAGAMGR